ncbi:hypothetical protein ABK040_008480 [Willaertia magna]
MKHQNLKEEHEYIYLNYKKALLECLRKTNAIHRNIHPSTNDKNNDTILRILNFSIQSQGDTSNFRQLFCEACYDLFKSLRKALTMMNILQFSSCSNSEQLGKEILMIQNISLKIFDNRLVKSFEIAKGVVLSGWKRTVSDFESIHDVSNEKFKKQVDIILDLMNQFNNLCFESIQYLNTIKEFTLNVHHHFSKIELRFECMLFSIQELLDSCASIRLEKIYNNEGRIPIKKLTILDVLNSDTKVNVNILQNGYTPRNWTPRAPITNNNNNQLETNPLVTKTQEFIDEDIEIERFDNISSTFSLDLEDGEYFQFPTKSGSESNIRSSLNSNSMKMFKEKMNWSECKHYIEDILSKEYSFISQLTEYMQHCLIRYKYTNIIVSSMGSIKFSMNSNNYKDFISNSGLKKFIESRNTNLNNNNDEDLLNSSFLKKSNTIYEDDVDSYGSVIEVLSPRIDKNIPSDGKYMTTSSDEILNNILELGDFSSCNFYGNTLKHLGDFYIERFSLKTQKIIDEENYYLLHGKTQESNFRNVIVKLKHFSEENNITTTKPTKALFYETVRDALKRIPKENFSLPQTFDLNNNSQINPICISPLFQTFYKSVMSIAIEHYIEGSLKEIDDKLPDIYNIISKSHHDNIFQNDLRSITSQFQGFNILEFIEKNWVIKNKFELISLLEIIVNYVYNKLNEFDTTNDKKLELSILGNDVMGILYIFDALYNLLGEIPQTLLQGESKLYSFQSELDKKEFSFTSTSNLSLQLQIFLSCLRRYLGKIVNKFGELVNREIHDILQNRFLDNEGHFGNTYVQFEKPIIPKGRQPRRRIVPLRNEKKNLMNEVLRNVFDGLLSSVFKKYFLNQQLHNQMLLQSLCILVNNYIEFIEEKHKENLNYLLKKKIKNQNEKIKSIEKLTMNLIEQLENDKLLLVEYVNCNSSLKNNNIYLNNFERTIHKYKETCKELEKGVYSLLTTNNELYLNLKSTKKNQVLPTQKELVFI